MFSLYSQLLELLLDVNECAQIPADKRIDLSAELPTLLPIPDPISLSDIPNPSELQSPEGQALFNEFRNMMDERKTARGASKPTKSLALLMATVPHLSITNP